MKWNWNRTLPEETRKQQEVELESDASGGNQEATSQWSWKQESENNTEIGTGIRFGRLHAELRSQKIFITDLYIRNYKCRNIYAIKLALWQKGESQDSPFFHNAMQMTSIIVKNTLKCLICCHLIVLS